MSQPKTKDARDLARQRKAERERAQKRRDSEAEGLAWVVFRQKVADLKSYDQALAFARTPLPNNPGRGRPEREFYDNFGYFLNSFLDPDAMVLPPRSSHAERALYLEFIERLDMAGKLPPDFGEKVKRVLRKSLAEPDVL